MPGFHRHGSGEWTEVAVGVVPRANFPEGLIGGVIDIQDTVLSGAATGIRIPRTGICSGTVSGTGLTFLGEPGGAAPESGTWNGEFHGNVGRDGPSGVAGDFAVSRPGNAAGTVKGYDVEGAFGATVIQEPSN